jgi:hypothetical protein
MTTCRACYALPWLVCLQVPLVTALTGGAVSVQHLGGFNRASASTLRLALRMLPCSLEAKPTDNGCALICADGHTVTVPIRSDSVVQPGAERVIVGEGMPISKSPGRHGGNVCTICQFLLLLRAGW